MPFSTECALDAHFGTYRVTNVVLLHGLPSSLNIGTEMSFLKGNARKDCGHIVIFTDPYLNETKKALSRLRWTTPVERPSVVKGGPPRELRKVARCALNV